MKLSVKQQILVTLGVGIVLIVGVFMLVKDPFGSPAVGADTAAKIYFADNISIAHRRVIEEFNRRYAGKIEVVPVDLPFTKFSTNERKELLARSLRSKSDRIDIFCVDHIWVSRFARWAAPMDEYLTPAERRGLLPYALESCSVDSHLVALPLYIDLGIMYYRRDLIRALPGGEAIDKRIRESITWEEFVGLKKYFPDRPLFLFQGDDFEGLVCMYFELLAAMDKQNFRKNALRLTSPSSVKAVGMLRDFVHVQKISPPEVLNYRENDCSDRLIAGDAVFMRNWPGVYRDVADNPIVRKLDVAPLPHFSGREPAGIFGGWNLMVAKSCTEKEAARTFVKFFLSEESQKLMYSRGGYLPVVDNVYEDTAFVRMHPDLPRYRRFLDHGVERPALVEYTKVSDIIAHFLHRVLAAEIPADQAMTQAQQMISSNKVLIK
ncbi:MAG TPA: extracellular solute-binding protein [Bacteroidota bacterium]|nr:extracellular solute-binding protein [Bacteroidota bacterium]